MRNSKRFMALLLAGTLAVSTLLSGCGSSDNSTADGKEGSSAVEEGGSSKKTKVTMVTYLGNPTRDALIQELVAQLDDIELEIISPPADQAPQKISAMLQAGEDIDIIELDSIPADHIANGFIEPLNSYVEGWEDWDSVSSFLKDQVASYDGNIYSIPYGVYERALFYRKDWFEERNMEVPKSWEDLYNAAVELTDPSQNRYGYSFRGGAGTTGFMQMTLLSYADPDKIDISTPFITKDGESVYEQPEAVEGLEFYKKLYEDGSHPDSIAWGYPEMVEAFYSGVTAMLIQDPEVVATCEQYMEEGTWDVAPLPVGPRGKALFPAGFAGWGIAKNSKNKDAAWEIIRTLSSVEGNTTFCKKNGSIPIHTAAQEDPFFSEGYYACYIEMAANPDAYVGYVDYGERRYASKEELEQMSSFGGASDGFVQEMLLGKITAQDCAQKAASYYSWVADSEWVKERVGK